MLHSSCATLCFHIPLCWALIFRLRFGYIGAALAISLSYWLNVIFQVCYMKYSSASMQENMGCVLKGCSTELEDILHYYSPSVIYCS
ncbi:hypothetical protein L6164_002938 [Bauhinia variegata]|uniref:Uncharacterized protein n=1 Tax=Bauhinia variegata TaxID=167791 RepID=A0ACB9PZR0_BAUVA|nr:hypothetical protein L6164_002938 [Bauhinia variegata]